MIILRNETNSKPEVENIVECTVDAKIHSLALGCIKGKTNVKYFTEYT